MATNKSDILKNPAVSGIFCLKPFLTAFFLVFLLSAASQPKLVVADAKKNFGLVKKGEVVKIDYEIINKGNQPLIINDVEVSCSCTTVEFPKQPILPSETVKVTVSFDTKTVYYRQDRIVYLNSNDPKGPAKLRYKGVVLKD